MAESLDVLRSDPYLGSLKDDDLEALAAALETEDVAAGTVLGERGAPPAGLMLVLDGEVEVHGLGATPRRLGRGSWLGGFAGVDTGGGVATATAAGNVRVARLAQPAYRSLHEGRPALRAALGLSVGAQLARAFRVVSRAVRDRASVGAESAVQDYDVVVIGAGPHGMSYATWLKQDRPETRIAIVEKRAEPGFKIGESTLGATVRSGLSLGTNVPTWRRLFNNKLGLHFWWMGTEDDELHAHVDHVVEETYQVERRVMELLYMNVARRLGIDIFEDTKFLAGESRLDGQPKEIACERGNGDRLRLRCNVVCDASGPAAVVGRARGIRRKWEPFNTNAYWGYFRKRSDVDLPTWDVAATRHLCFPEGWVWFIELASWEQAPRQNLEAMIDHLLDNGSRDEADYPTREELSRQFDCALEQFPISVGVVPRSDIDSAVDLPLEERFQHYVDKYPVFKRIMDTYELIEEPYPGHPTYISYLEITQNSDRYTGDGWLLLGDAAFFVNPLYSPGMTYGHSMASAAAKVTLDALERGDFSEAAFAPYEEGARGMFDALVTECEMWYRAYRHPDSMERSLHLRIAAFIGLQHQRILAFGGVPAMRQMIPLRPPGPQGEAIMNPRYQQLVNQIVGALREIEARGGSADETAAAVRAVVDPLVEEVAAMEGVQQLKLGDALQNYDNDLRRVPSKPDWVGALPNWKCARCTNRTPAQFEACYVCGEPKPADAPAAPPAPPMPAFAGSGPPGH